MFKKREKLFNRIGLILAVLAFIPAFVWALKSAMFGKHGESINNFYGQPLHPIIILVVMGFIAVLLPMYYFRKRGEEEKGRKKEKRGQKRDSAF